MVRRLILGVVVGVVLLGGTAAGQNSPPTVLPVTIVAPTTSETVLPVTIVPVIVKGIVIERPLPRTGNDFGIEVIVGSALTAAGLAFAITARIRRQRVNAPASS